MAQSTVMIVDDDKDFLEELEETLSLNGYAVVTVSNPSRVLEIASQKKPAVILLDLKMKHTNGFELADELGRFAQTIDIPVIAMTGFFTENEHIALMNICGIHKCITKPFSAPELIGAIESAIKKPK